MDFQVRDFAESLLNVMADAVIYADAEGLIRYWNPAAERLFGYTAQDAVGQSLDLIIPASLRGRHWDGYAKTMQTGQTRYGAGDLLAVPAVRKDGVRISIEFTIAPFHDDAGRISGIAAVVRDATARFEEMKALRQAASPR